MSDTPYIVIDSNLRTMTIPSSINNLGVENDKDVHRLYFKMPRYFCEYDLSDFTININYLNANGHGDMYHVTDAEVGEEEITFSWLAGRYACLYKGTVTFIVCLKLADDGGDVAQEYNTTLASLKVLPGLETEPAILENDYDIIEQLLLEISDTNDKIQAILDSGMSAEELGQIAAEQALLKSRMDEFTSLTDGSTTGDAELIDGRVGYDGTVYTNIGGAIRGQVNELKADLQDDAVTIGDSVYTSTELSSVQTSTGWKLTDDGYRVADEAYQLMRFRVFAGDAVKVVSDHKWQFSTSTTVTASGTKYRVGNTRQTGTFYVEVPETVTYVVVSTPITNSGVHCYKLTSKITTLSNSVTALGESIATDIADVVDDSDTKFASLFNAYTSQVSDITYPGTVTAITIGIDTTNEKLVTGSQHALCIPIISGTSIRVQKPQTVYCQICFTTDYPAPNVDITHRTSMNSIVNTEFVAESLPADNYVVIYTHTTEISVSDCTFAYSQTARGTVKLLPQLDPHMINLLKYRPVGKVSKAYIALSCDDGLEPLATYTLPRIQYWNNYYSTNIPLHMALFDGSPVFANAEYTALVKDMCDNHNCSIGIHGTQPYEYYSSPTLLYAYLNKQWDTIIEKTGVTPTSVIYPHSSYNDQIMVMTAGFCGICGASGSDPSPYTYSDDHGLAFYVGEKSNCYEVYRLSIKDTRIGNANEAHRIIDYAIAHNLIICPYFHDIDFTNYSEETNNYNRAMLDAFIQYGMEQGVEFINFGDIPKLL